MTEPKKTYPKTKAPQSLTADQEYALLMEFAAGGNTTRQDSRMIRNITMANVMLEAGLRVNELVQLIHSDLWFQSVPVSTLIVRQAIAKGNRERKIPVSQQLRTIIFQMAKEVWWPDQCEPTDFAFYINDPKEQLTTRTVQRIIKKAGMTSIGIKVTPHMLRHTFASRVLAKSNLKVVQELLGHSSIATTQRYCHPNGQQLADAINASSVRS
ncbi:MAG: site-specific integrase [Planctomycetes bacterium]|nr:site-specific integrase [Planctomycetota bacterium]